MYKAWLKAVDKLGKRLEKPAILYTASTARLLNFLRRQIFIQVLGTGFSQPYKISTQPFGTILPLFGWLISTLSTAPIAANKYLIN